MTEDLKYDSGLDALLSLSGYTYFIGNKRHWVKFEAHRVTPTTYIPHGISYSLTLHDRNNVRIMGYDNAHQSKPHKKKYRANVVKWDHIHKINRVIPYEFDSPSQLLEDFWKTVEEFV